MPKKEKEENENEKGSKNAFAVLIILLFFLAVIDISALVLLRPSAVSEGKTISSGTVSEILDGKTIRIETGETVKLIGIDSPSAGSQYYEESKRFLSFMTLGKKARLEKDAEDKDGSGNFLRYVYVDYNGKEVFVNLESARQGYSIPFHIGGNVKYRAEIEKAREECIKDKLNLCGL